MQLAQRHSGGSQKSVNGTSDNLFVAPLVVSLVAQQSMLANRTAKTAEPVFVSTRRHRARTQGLNRNTTSRRACRYRARRVRQLRLYRARLGRPRMVVMPNLPSASLYGVLSGMQQHIVSRCGCRAKLHLSLRSAVCHHPSRYGDVRHLAYECTSVGWNRGT